MVERIVTISIRYIGPWWTVLASQWQVPIPSKTADGTRVKSLSQWRNGYPDVHGAAGQMGPQLIFERSDFDYQSPPIMVSVPWWAFSVVAGAYHSYYVRSTLVRTGLDSGPSLCGGWLIDWLIGVVSRLRNLDATLIPYQVCLRHNIKRGFMLLRRELKNDSGRVYYTCIDAGWVSSVSRFAARISGGSTTTYSVLWVSIMPSKGNGKRQRCVLHWFLTVQPSPPFCTGRKKKKQFYSMEHSEQVRA